MIVPVVLIFYAAIGMAISVFVPLQVGELSDRERSIPITDLAAYWKKHPDRAARALKPAPTALRVLAGVFWVVVLGVAAIFLICTAWKAGCETKRQGRALKGPTSDRAPNA